MNQKLITQMYENDLMSIREIAEALNYSKSTVVYHMKKYGIKSRSHHEALLVRRGQYSNTNPKMDGAFYLNTKNRYIIKINGEVKTRYRLMVDAIIEGDLHPNLCIHHLNGDSTDDRFANLAIAHIYIHNVHSLHPKKCTNLKTASIPLSRFAGLEDKMELRKDGYYIHDDFEKISQYEIIELAFRHLWICNDCRKCSKYAD